MAKEEKPVIPCPECGARHGDQCTYSLCPRRSISNARRTARSPGHAFPPVPRARGTYSNDRGERFSLISTQDRCGVCRRARFSTGNPLNLSAGRFCVCVNASRSHKALGPFSFGPRVLQNAKGRMSESDQFVTPFSRFQTCNEWSFSCGTIYSETETRQFSK